jgi:hypothetical protein
VPTNQRARHRSGSPIPRKTLPTGTPFASVSLKPVQGWTAAAEKSKLATPIKAHDTEITEAVSKITWTKPEHPAPVRTLTPAATATAPAAGAPAAAASTLGDGNGTPWGIAGTVLGLAALILGLLTYRRSGNTPTAERTAAEQTVSTSH